MKNIYFFMIVCSLFFGCGKNSDDGVLKIGLMPAVDSIPFFYAQEEGLFEAEGISVEITVFTNAQNRQTALQTNQIDGAMTDLVALITNASNDFPLKGTLSIDGLFPLLVSPRFESDEKPAIGMMEISVSNYLVEQYMQHQEYDKVFINEIPMRLEAVGSNQIAMGLFPEPIASIGASRGLEKLIFEGIPEESLDIMAFTERALTEKRKSIKGFHKTYGKAVSALKDNPQLCREVLIRNIRNIPPGIKDDIDLPVFNSPAVPSADFVTSIISWTEKIIGKKITLEYSDIIETEFVK